MSLTCRQHVVTTGQMGRCCRHKIEDVGTFCVGLSRHPYFPPKTRPAQVRMLKHTMVWELHMDRYAPSCSQHIVLMSHFVVELSPTSFLRENIIDILDNIVEIMSSLCDWGHQLSNCLKKTTSSWQKGRELAVKLGYGMTVLVALEEERGEIDMYMVLSSYYYDMSAINDTTWHTTQKKTRHAWCRQRVSCVGPLCREDTKTCLQN